MLPHVLTSRRRAHRSGYSKHITFDANKVETKHEISSNDELYKVKDLLRATVSAYESGGGGA